MSFYQQRSINEINSDCPVCGSADMYFLVEWVTTMFCIFFISFLFFWQFIIMLRTLLSYFISLPPYSQHWLVTTWVLRDFLWAWKLMCLGIQSDGTLYCAVCAPKVAIVKLRHICKFGGWFQKAAIRISILRLRAGPRKPRVMHQAGILLFLRRPDQISRPLPLYHVTGIFYAPRPRVFNQHWEDVKSKLGYYWAV
jgi:hypothetical protein